MAKKAKRTTKPKVWTKEQVLAFWKKHLKKGLGTKTLHADIVTAFEGALLAKIQQRIDEGQDFNYAMNNSKKVAKIVGQICKLMTPGNQVVLGIFEKAFKLAQLHPACPGGGGAGQWCDI
jgi:hypothetical protein